MLKLIGDDGPVDMFSWDLVGLANSTALTETTTKAVFFDIEDNETYTFTGKGFTYDSHGNPTGGTVTGFEYDIGSSENFHVTGMNVAVSTFLSYVGTNDVVGLMTTIMAGGDSLKGSALADQLYGLGGDDIINGGRGDDQIIGGAGADHLTGGAGRDTFIYGALSDSTNAAPDTITDLAKTDTIDLSAIDADSTRNGNQTFKLVHAFDHHAGEALLKFDEAHDRTLLQLDVNGDGKADATIVLSGDQSAFHHFVL